MFPTKPALELTPAPIMSRSFVLRRYQQRRTVHFQETLEQVVERNLVVEALVDQSQEHLEVDQSQKDLINQVVQNLTEHSPRVWLEQLEVER